MKSKDRNTFIFNEDWGEAIDTAPIEEQLNIYKAIRKYAIYGEMPELPIYSTGIMCTIKLQIDRNRRKYNEVREKRSAAGKAGNLKRWGEKYKESQKVANIANATKCYNCEQKSQEVANITDNVNDNVNDNEIKDNNTVSFDIFWDLYDKKVDRKTCEPKWNKLSETDKKAALEYIPKYKEAEPRKAFRKNPETFLNRRAWENELIFKDEEMGINTGVIPKEGYKW